MTQVATEPKTFDPDKVYDLPLKSIYVDEVFNCRGPVDPVNVIDLAHDIQANGLDQPITVEVWNQNGKEFRLIAGYRRFKAHQVIKKETIRSLVKPTMSDMDARLMNIRENVQRQDLNIKQEAKAIEIFKNAGWTEEETSRKVNMSRGWVQIRYMLLEMPEQIQDEAAAGIVKTTDIRTLYRLHSPEEQFAFVRALKDKKLLGKKREIKPHQVKLNQKKVRSLEELDEMQDLIRETLGNNLATAILGWAMAYNSDLEAHQAIKKECEKINKFYAIPDGLEGTRANAGAIKDI